MRIEVLGPGCPNCEKLFEETEKAVNELGLGSDVDISYFQDFAEIANRGVMSTPALAIDGDVEVGGRVPSKRENKDLLR